MESTLSGMHQRDVILRASQVESNPQKNTMYTTSVDGQQLTLSMLSKSKIAALYIKSHLVPGKKAYRSNLVAISLKSKT